MKKRIIFLDGDGTLWYPTKTKRTEKPHWIYDHPDTKDSYLEHLELTPDSKDTLKQLQERGYYLVVISANPREESIAVNEIKVRLHHFNIAHNFLNVRSSPGDNPKGKSAVILEVLKDLNMNKEDALMVGDSFVYDYVAAKEVGVDAFWIENDLSIIPENYGEIHKIKEISDLLTILN